MNKLLSRNARKNIIDLSALGFKKDHSFIQIKNSVDKLINIATKNFRNKVTNHTETSNNSISITSRNFAENNNKKQYDPFKNKLKNKEYFKNDTDYLKRVVKVQEKITPEELKDEKPFNDEKQNKNQVDVNTDNQRESKIEDQKPEEFLKKIIEETSNKKLSDYITDEKLESAQEKYKEINFDYFKQKEIFTRSQVLGVKSKIEKASKADPEWGMNLHRKFLQRNFLKRNNIFYDFEKEPFEDKKINYDFLKNLKLEEPILIYEGFLQSLKPMISAKRHAIAYGLMLPYAYLMFFFNWEFLFSATLSKNFGHMITNLVFIGFVSNCHLMRYYNKTLVTQIKYDGKDDSVIFYTHRGFNNGILEVKHKVGDLFAFKSNSFFLRRDIYIKSVKDPNILYIVPVKGIFHEREAFNNIFDINVNESPEESKRKKKEGVEKKKQNPDPQEKTEENKDNAETSKNNEEPIIGENYQKKKDKEKEIFN